MAPNFFNTGILQKTFNRKIIMKLSFSHNSVVKISTYNTVHMGPKYYVIKGLHCIFSLKQSGKSDTIRE